MLNNLPDDIQKTIYKKIWSVEPHNKIRLTNKSIYNLYKEDDLISIYKYEIYKEKFINVVKIVRNNYKSIFKLEPL